MLKFVPPAGAPVATGQILRAVKKSLSFNGTSTELLRCMATRLQVRHVFATSSGRCGLYVILKALHGLRPDRGVVALPAYTCFSVPAAIVRAGLRLYPVDIDPETLDFDFKQLSTIPDKDLLCILTSHLFGLVNDTSRTGQIAIAKGAFLVDDAAQALGASRQGSLAGTLGHAGLYSFGRGKVLAIGEGGLVVTNSEEIAHAIQNEVVTLPNPSSAHAASQLAEMLAYAIFLNPRLYWITNSMPFLKLGVTEFAPNFPMARLGALPNALLVQLMGGLSELNEVRLRNATFISTSLNGNPHFVTPKPASDSRPAYIRFPIIADTPATRFRTLTRLRAAGIGASPFYPSAICDINSIGKHVSTDRFHCPQAEALAERLLTLPTHPLVGQRDLDRMAEILNRLETR